MRRCLGRGAVAGLAGGAAMAVVLAVAGEGPIGRAIALEAGGSGEVFSRGAQQAGGAAGALLFGMAAGALMAVVFALVRHRMAAADDWRAAVTLAATSFATVFLVPFLRYPANPPGVGDPETIGLRQGLYVVVLVLGVLGTMAAIALGQRLRGQLGSSAWPVTLVAYAAYCAALYATLPPNPDPTPIPADLLAAFRLRSVLGLLIYWGVFAAAFGLLVNRRASRNGARPRPRTLPEAGQA